MSVPGIDATIGVTWGEFAQRTHAHRSGMTGYNAESDNSDNYWAWGYTPTNKEDQS